jgi:acyl carrier protein
MSGITPETEEKLLEIIGMVFKKDPHELNMATTLRGDLQAKSINFMEISAMVERQFHKEIRVYKMLEVQTIGDILNLIRGAQ